tara:strand:- start:109 stop:333 length:225 start_codon:yes stop_codon:yes gene_type:complete
MIGTDEIKEMQDIIASMEKELAEKKRVLREAKYAGLRSAMQARKEADEAVKQELKDLGITSTPFGTPFDFHWKF